MDKKAIYNCKKQLIDKNLSGALKAITPLLNDYAYSSLCERIINIRDDYELMLSYFRQGFPDPSRNSLYVSLLRRLDRLVNDAALIQRTHNTPIHGFTNSPTNIAFQTKLIKQTLEAYISETAILGLNEPSSSNHSDVIHQEHHEFMSKLFEALCHCRQWHQDEQAFYEQLILSPTIENRDAALLTSAISLSVITHFDIYKYLTLAHVYQGASDKQLRQRALVGWALTTTRTHSLYPEVKAIVSEMLSDEETSRQLMEMQMQMFFCMNAEKDNAEITRDIMPNLMKNKGFEITRNGIVEKEDDPLQDILDPESSDRAMEELERSFQRMAEMQRNGSDIYFGGFKQMKRYAFFYTLSNWFCPFYREHPSLANTVRKLQNTQFLDMLQKNGPFCDSDKYSFALALATVVDKIPENMKSALNEGGASFGPMANDELIQSEANIRLMYLQDLYRFFRLSDFRHLFYNPFGGEDGRNALFYAYDIYKGAFGEADVLKMGNFLLKRNLAKALELLLNNNPPQDKSIRYTIMLALCKINNGHHEEAHTLLKTVIHRDPDNKRGLSAYARLSLQLGDYEEAEQAYRKLVSMSPDNKAYCLNYCIALIKNKKAQEALQLLYKLNYESPDNLDVSRVLAWCLMVCNKIPQANKEYERILSNDAVTADDYLNAGYCHWISGNMAKAISSIKRYQSNLSPDTTLYDEIVKDQDILIEKGISPCEIRMMVDLME
jgi:Tfp pilus assembly protein PilF